MQADWGNESVEREVVGRVFLRVFPVGGWLALLLGIFFDGGRKMAVVVVVGTWMC